MSDKRYEGNKTFKENGKVYLANTLYPDVPVSENDWYVITTVGDRFDLLSQQFYKRSDYWWVIAIANNLPVDTLCPEIGVQLRIPADPEGYFEILKLENE